MKKTLLALTTLALLGGALVGCGNKSNTPPPTPLEDITPQIKAKSLWNTNIGNGTGEQLNLNLQPVIDNSVLYAVSYDGRITAINTANGKRIWRTSINANITATPAISGSTLIVGTLRGEMYAIDTKTGKQLWSTKVPSSLFSQPLIANDNVYILTHDGSVSAYSLKDGQQQWIQTTEIPELMLVGNSSPIIVDNILIVGTSSGVLWGFDPESGDKKWDNPIALPTGLSPAAQMVDITATPVISGEIIFLATYQGNLIAFNMQSGQPLWRKKASIFNQMSVGNESLFVTNADGSITARSQTTGDDQWNADILKWRKTSGPLFFKGYVVAGDLDGYVHFFDAQTGKYLDRLDIGGDGISSQPITDGQRIYVQTNNGRIYAITP